MTTLYERFLPLAQQLSTYGGNPTAFHISRMVLDAIDDGAEGTDPILGPLRQKLVDTINGWNGLHDHPGFSAIFEAFYEAVFYLVARAQGVALRPVPAGGD